MGNLPGFGSISAKSEWITVNVFTIDWKFSGDYHRILDSRKKAKIDGDREVNRIFQEIYLPRMKMLPLMMMVTVIR